MTSSITSSVMSAAPVATSAVATSVTSSVASLPKDFFSLAVGGEVLNIGAAKAEKITKIDGNSDAQNNGEHSMEIDEGEFRGPNSINSLISQAVGSFFLNNVLFIRNNVTMLL